MSNEYELEEVVDEMSGGKVEVGSKATGDRRAEGGGSEDVEEVDKDEAGGVGTMADYDGWVLREMDETGAECEGASGIGDAELEVWTTGSSAGAGT